MAKQRRKDKILLYEEASIIASNLGVIDRVDLKDDTYEIEIQASKKNKDADIMKGNNFDDNKNLFRR